MLIVPTYNVTSYMPAATVHPRSEVCFVARPQMAMHVHRLWVGCTSTHWAQDLKDENNNDSLCSNSGYLPEEAINDLLTDEEKKQTLIQYPTGIGHPLASPTPQELDTLKSLQIQIETEGVYTPRCPLDKFEPFMATTSRLIMATLYNPSHVPTPPLACVFRANEALELTQQQIANR